MMIREYCKQFYTQKFDNFGEKDHFLKKHKLPQFTPNKVDNLNNPITIKEIEFIT